MARLAISKDYFPAYARLPRKAQHRADEFLKKFEHDSKLASIHLEPLHDVLDGALRSARIGDDYRMILRAPERGDVFLVLYADHHDEAYRWAATKRTAIHPKTGSLQIFDVERAERALPTVLAPPPVAPASTPTPTPGLFDAHPDETLFLAGVPWPLLPAVRAVQSEEQLDRLLPHLPPEGAEMLTGLAAGLSLDEALEEVFGRVAPPAAAPEPPAPDVLDLPAALERPTTQRQFRLLDGELDLDRALRHPLDVWRVFLHPRQKRIAEARTKGPMRVLGGAGTGKTVAALHRAAFLAKSVYPKPDDRILFTTFTTNLAEDLRAQLGKLLEPDALARVEVRSIDAWAAALLRSRGKSARLALDEDQRRHFRAAYEGYGQDEIPLDFYWAEWRDVVREQGLTTADEYVAAVRRHRGVPLSRAERRRLWPVFQAYREDLEGQGLKEPFDLLRAARAELEAAPSAPRYRSIVLDEAQDFSLEALRLVRAIAGPEHPDDLFLVGDAHQRIYGRRVTLSSAGISVRGRRTQTLRLNYRTTGAIGRYATRVLGDAEVDDLDDGKADRRGYVSVREGPPPVVRHFPTARAEEEAALEIVRELLAIPLPAESICLLARTRGILVDRFAPALSRAGIPCVLLDRQEPAEGGVRLATMHRAKGLEFAAVLLVDVSEGVLPWRSPELESEDALVSELALSRERALLYVAASRARDELYVLSHGEPSVLLPSLPVPVEIPQPPQPVEAAARPERPAPDPVPPSPEPAQTAILDTPLVYIPLPKRMESFAEREGLVTLGDLLRRSPRSLAGERNLGRKSIVDTRAVLEPRLGLPWEEALRRLTAGGTLAPLPVVVSVPAPWVDPDQGLFQEGLIGAFRLLLQELEPIPRLILTRRSGLGGESLTLQELGEMLGISRERVRQIQAKTLERLAKRSWARAARAAVDEALAAGAAPLASLSEQAFWTDAAELPEVTGFVLESVLERGYVVTDEEEPWLSPVDEETFRSQRAAARPGTPTRRQELLALLEASAVPLTRGEIEAQLGPRPRLPDEVIHFGRSRLGLRKHFPDFEAWRARLVPRAEELVEQLGPERQWSSVEILDELREALEIPDWLTAWGLAELIRAGSRLKYLGRLRVALPGSPENASRIRVHELAEQLLRDAGEPMTRDELVSRIRERLGASELALLQVFTRPQFVRLDARRMGLLDRDVPGGARAVAEATEHAEALLRRRERGLSSYRLLETVAGLSAELSRWSEELLTSVVRGDARFRTSQSGAVGLAEWESTRTPTRLELARAALAEAGGKVSVEAVLGRIEAHYGERPTRATVGAIAMHLGVALDGDWLRPKS
jgi:superfamily I DNA/RNA helicase/mRNA-degrading endonuclease RelE of RelBE toxin-antitoxin system